MSLDGKGPWHGVPDMNFTTDPYLPGKVEELLKSGQFNHNIQVIIGTNTEEGIMVVGPMTNGLTEWDEYREGFEIGGTRSLFGIANASEITNEDLEKMHTLVEFYVGSIENINEKHKYGVIDMFTDSSFQYGTHQTINYLVEHNVTVYQYIFSYHGKYSTSLLFGGTPVGTGVSHGDDLIYLWISSAAGVNDISGILGP